MKKLAFILVAAIAAFFSAAAYADDYPSRPITIVKVFGPGSGSDTVSRIIADKLKGERPHPRRIYRRRVHLHDTTSHGAVGKHIVVVAGRLSGTSSPCRSQFGPCGRGRANSSA